MTPRAASASSRSAAVSSLGKPLACGKGTESVPTTVLLGSSLWELAGTRELTVSSRGVASRTTRTGLDRIIDGIVECRAPGCRKTVATVVLVQQSQGAQLVD